MTENPKSLEEVWLHSSHTVGTKQSVLDLHTYLYHKGFYACPICNEWLIQREIPKIKGRYMMTLQKKWKGRCGDCGHYEIRHGTPCQSSDQYGHCLCQRWVKEARK